MNAKTLLNRMAVAGAAAFVLLTGCQKKEEPAAPATVSAPAKPAIVSAEKNSFDEVTAKLDKGGNFYLYLSTEKALSGLSNRLTAASNVISGLPTLPSDGREAVQKGFALLDLVVKESGISQISGLGMSSIAREKGFYYNKMIVHHYPGQDAGLAWTLFGKAAHPIGALDLLPESTAMAFASDLDVPLLWTSIQHAVQTLAVPDVSAAFEQAPAQFKEKTGVELDALLHSLAGEYGMFLTLDQHKTVTLPLGPTPMEIPNPGLCFFCKVNSDLIFNTVEEHLKGNPMLAAMMTKVDEPNLKMRTVTIPLPIPVDVRPSLARVGDYLLLASSDTLVREIVAVKAGQKKGYKSSDEFKKLSQGVPSEGNNFTLISGVLGSTFGQIQEKSMASQNMDPEALKTFRQLTAEGTNCGAFSVGANCPDGWEGIGNGSQGGEGVLILPAVAVAAIGAAMVLPALAKAKAHRKLVASIIFARSKSPKSNGRWIKISRARIPRR